MNMQMNTIQEINARLFFSSGDARPAAQERPWQYVQMEYDRMGLPAPSAVPRLDTIEDAEIWLCLDERYNRGLRMRESALAV